MAQYQPTDSEDSDSSVFTYILDDLVTTSYIMRDLSKETLDEALEEWEKSKDYPRKKKKAVRKMLEKKIFVFSHVSEMFLFKDVRKMLT